MVISFQTIGGKKLMLAIDTVNKIDNFTHKIYDDWHAIGWLYETGIVIGNNKTHKKTIIKGKIKTKQGGLNYLNENDILPYTDEAF